MTARGHCRGHPMCYDESSGEWRYDDDGSPVPLGWRERPCGYCSRMHAANGHDPCLGELPGVVNACCGHGVQSESYVQFANGVVLRGFVIDVEREDGDGDGR